LTVYGTLNIAPGATLANDGTIILRSNSTLIGAERLFTYGNPHLIAEPNARFDGPTRPRHNAPDRQPDGVHGIHGRGGGGGGGGGCNAGAFGIFALAGVLMFLRKRA